VSVVPVNPVVVPCFVSGMGVVKMHLEDAATVGGRGNAGGGLSNSVICAFCIYVRGL
jgi:hypothetical protein